MTAVPTMLIPARAGSSLSNKNLYVDRQSGLSLLALAVVKCRRAAETLGRGDPPIVLTDSERYAREATLYGARAVMTPPTGDTDDVTLKIRQWTRNEHIAPDTPLAIVQATSPQLSVSTLVRAARAAEALAPLGGTVLVSVVPEKPKFTGLFYAADNGTLLPAVTAFGKISPSKPRQLLPRLWRFTGAITVFAAARLANETLFDGAELRPIFHTADDERADIDTADDARAANLVPPAA